MCALILSTHYTSIFSITHLLQVDDEHFDFALQARPLLLKARALDDQSVVLLFNLGDANCQFASDFFNFFGTGKRLCLVLGFPGHDTRIGTRKLTLQIQSGLDLFFQLHANGFQLNFKIVHSGLQRGTALKNKFNILLRTINKIYISINYALFIFALAAQVIVLHAELVLNMQDAFIAQLQFLNILDQYSVFLRETNQTINYNPYQKKKKQLSKSE